MMSKSKMAKGLLAFFIASSFTGYAVAEQIIALRNEKGSYNPRKGAYRSRTIIALRNEKGSYNTCSIINKT